MTFLSGFAEGFIAERDKVRNRKNELDDQSFQYRMKFLTEQREKRDAKKLQETEWSKKAKDLAAQAGDPAMAQYFYKELANGIDYETNQSRIVKGEIKPNPNFKAPNQTIKIPDGVSMTNPTGAVQETDPYSAFPKNETVDARIDAIDPSLRKPVQSETNEFSTMTDNPNNQFVYKPSGKIDVGDYADNIYAREVAIQQGDKVAEQTYDLKIKAQEMALAKEAYIKKPNSTLYVIKDIKTGKMVSSPFTGEVRGRDLYNTSNPTVDANGERGKVVSIDETQEIVDMPPEAFESLEKLTDKFAESSAKVNEAQSYAVSALGSARGMVKILNETPEVTTDTAGGLEWMRNVTAEVDTAFKVIQQGEAELDAAFKTGDAATVQKLLKDQTENVKEIEEAAMRTTGLMGPRNQLIASNKAVYRSLSKLYTYQIAAANGISAAKMSDKDFTIFSEISGGEKKNPDDVKRAIQNSYLGIMNNLDAAKAPINNDPRIKKFTELWKINPGLEIPRIGDQLMQMQFEGEGGEERRAGLLATLKELSGKQEMGKARAVIQAQVNAVQSVGASGSAEIGVDLGPEPTTVSTKEEYDALPSGAIYLDPTGKKRTKK